MRWLEKLFRILLWCLTGLMGIYIVYRGFLLGQEPRVCERQTASGVL